MPVIQFRVKSKPHRCDELYLPTSNPQCGRLSGCDLREQYHRSYQEVGHAEHEDALEDVYVCMCVSTGDVSIRV